MYYLVILVILMKSLILVRHAKSSWDSPELSDKERPLNSRGKHDAPMMGKLLNKLGLKAELIISSPAKRARQTAKRIAKEIGYKEEDIQVDNNLYMAGIEDFYDVIGLVNDKVNTLFVFSHNYGITDFANYISNSDIDNIPTCGIVRIDLDIDSWSKIKNEKGKLVFFEYPKKYINGL